MQTPNDRMMVNYWRIGDDHNWHSRKWNFPAIFHNMFCSVSLLFTCRRGSSLLIVLINWWTSIDFLHFFLSVYFCFFFFQVNSIRDIHVIRFFCVATRFKMLERDEWNSRGILHTVKRPYEMKTLAHTHTNVRTNERNKTQNFRASGDL